MFFQASRLLCLHFFPDSYHPGQSDAKQPEELAHTLWGGHMGLLQVQSSGLHSGEGHFDSPTQPVGCKRVPNG